MKWIACLFAMPALLCADWKIVTRTGGATMTEYFKGSLTRKDSSPVYTTVLDFEHRRQVNWRNDLRQYEIVEWPPEVRTDPSLPAIEIERQTTDTGGRKQFFGRTARHLVSHVTRSDGPETVIDGWYIEAPGLGKQKSGFSVAFGVLTMVVAGQSPAVPRIEMKQIGPEPTGLPVLQKTISNVAQPRGASQKYETVSEVTELFEGTLPHKVFQAPDGYQRVTNLPYPTPPTWAELVGERWRRFQGWISSLF
ncbi:MAG TPA: hypothetical protein VGF59_27545 [Bryobacteraceae bacterium]|jgi:hypothetical protein